MIEKNEQLCTFNNKNEELEYYKSKYESFFKELVKYQLKVKSLENSNNELREKVSNYLNVNSSKNNNIGENYLTPSEFKKLWEYTIKTELIETFDFCINEYILIANLCQDIMLLIYEECKKTINNKFIEVLNCLNLGKISKDKREEIFNHFLPFFRDNFNKIFIFSEKFLEIINKKFLSVIIEYNYKNDIINENQNESKSKNHKYITNNKDIDNIDKNFINKIQEKIKQNNFDDIIKSFYKICIYMLLHEPILTFNLEKYSKRKLKYFYYNKNDFINVEGFINDNSPCIMLLSAPLIKNKFNFYNLRSPVYIVHNPDKLILEECEKNKNNDLNEVSEDKKNNINSIRNSCNKKENLKEKIILNNKINKTFEEKNPSPNNNSNQRKSPKNSKLLNNKNINCYIKSCQNIIKTNGVYNNNLIKKIDLNLKNHKIENKKTEKNSNIIDSKILYVVSKPNTINKNNNKSAIDIAQNYINKNSIEKKASNINIFSKIKSQYCLSSSSGNIGIGKKEDNNIKTRNSYNNLNNHNNRINKLNMEKIAYDEIIGNLNLNRLKDTKLKEYYINNNNYKNNEKNTNSKYCIKNRIYNFIKNMPNTTNNRIIIKKNNYVNDGSQNFDLILNKQISPSPSYLFKSYETYNDSSEINVIPSPKYQKFKNYNSFTHLLKFSNMNSIAPSNTPVQSSQNSIYNNLVIKGIKNNIENNIINNGTIKNSYNNLNYNINFINNNSYSNTNSIINSNIIKNNFNPLSNRKKYISDVKKHEKKNKENKSEINERCSINNYIKKENKIKNKFKNNISQSSSHQKYNNINNKRNTNIINDEKKMKKFHKKIIKNGLMVMQELNNTKNFNNYFNDNCKKINNNKKINNINNKIRYKYNNKFNKKTNFIIYKNLSNNNINIKENVCHNNNCNEECNLNKYSHQNTFIQKTINKSSSPDINYLKIDKSTFNEEKNNNILFHRNSNTTLYNNCFTSDSDNNISSNKKNNNNNNKQSFIINKKDKRKSSYNYTNINNNIKNKKNPINRNKDKAFKYIKSIKSTNKCNTKEKNFNQNIFRLKQIYKNSKTNSQKPIISLPKEAYTKTEENNKETTPFKEKSIVKNYNKSGSKNKTLENSNNSSLTKIKKTKREIKLKINNKKSFDKLIYRKK